MHSADDLPLSGWYSDPHGLHQSRWWTGTTWAADVKDDGFLRSLPWLRWCVWLAPMAVVGFVCFGRMEVKAAVHPERWFWAALVAIFLLTVLGSAATNRDHGWLAMLVFSVAVAAAIALTILATAAPATSASCAGTSDCDTSFGLGLLFLVAAFTIPAFAFAALGTLVARLLRSRSH